MSTTILGFVITLSAIGVAFLHIFYSATEEKYNLAIEWWQIIIGVLLGVTLIAFPQRKLVEYLSKTWDAVLHFWTRKPQDKK